MIAGDNHQWIAHYHTGGVPGRHELDDTQELNWRSVAKAIADTGFTLTITRIDESAVAYEYDRGLDLLLKRVDFLDATGQDRIPPDGESKYGGDKVERVCDVKLPRDGIMQIALYGRLDRTWLALIVLAIWTLQLLISPLWLARYRFGPAEWVWRSLTYWRLQPMRREVPALAEA